MWKYNKFIKYGICCKDAFFFYNFLYWKRLMQEYITISFGIFQSLCVNFKLVVGMYSVSVPETSYASILNGLYGISSHK